MRFLMALAMAASLQAQQPFVPADFAVRRIHKTSQFQLTPLGPELAKEDFDAYMSSIEHLQKTFSGSTRWHNDKITMADAIKDVEGEKARFDARKSFTYAVLARDGKGELGCAYISPSKNPGYDAMVHLS